MMMKEKTVLASVIS